MMPKTGNDILNMSDEDFMKNPPDFDDQPAPTSEISSSGSDPEGGNLSAETDDTVDTGEGNQENENSEGVEDAKEGSEGNDAPDGDNPDNSDDSDDDADSEKGKQKAEENDPDAENADKASQGVQSNDPKTDNSKSKESTDTKGKPDEVKSEEIPVDYQAFYNEVMKPFKANGREIKLKSPDEAIRLMQMGAGFGRKLQDLQPYLKTVRMLEKNGLLDEQKLSFLIEVNQKNPDAIKKLLKDSAIDPLDLNMEDNAEYKPRNHGVTDAEMAFQDVLQDVQAHPTGKETLRLINNTWDQQSKALLWESPELLKVIQSQRETGVYDQIVAEIDRQKLLGDIPPSTPFIRAYKMAGDALVRSAGLNPPLDSGNIQSQNTLPGAGGQPPLVQSPQQPQPRVLATRASTPKAQVTNDEKARAAATPQATPRKATQKINPLEMADEDFLKQFEGRL